MSLRLSAILRLHRPGYLMFWCPGCKEQHAFQIGSEQPIRWSYNGDPERPTFSPSLLINGTRFTEKGRADYEAWTKGGPCPEGDQFEVRPHVCHSFVTDGLIQFLGDSTHELAGQTVAIPEWPQ